MRIAKNVLRLEAYVPGEQPKCGNVVKLNTNENPYPPSPKAAKILASFDPDRLRRYPDPNFTELREAIARRNGTTADRVFVGNGSDEILSLAAKAFVENDGSIGSLDPSYSLYKTLAAIRDVPWKASRKCSLFLWTNPNAPTGTFAPVEEIAKFAKRFKGVVIVDEAYADFARDNAMRLATAEENKNLIVMRTFSKSYSLAGLRVGYAVGPKDLINALFKVKDSYNVDAIAQAVALAAYKDQGWMKRNAAKIKKTRTFLTKELEKRGWDVPPSEANFVFAKPPEGGPDAKATFEALKERKIFTRYFAGAKTGDRIRITVGTDEQTRILLEAIDAIHKQA
ncbi:MAG: aminotransferase class I/II-fold pyridoxal phosphate-dependent enzyme [Kiritimatiellae bacterium]|nr:aminotransferase class I/II-fold pyridoxal phosphate-dependent enzyme [Kiritimatiellia bacterium]